MNKSPLARLFFSSSPIINAMELKVTEYLGTSRFYIEPLNNAQLGACRRLLDKNLMVVNILVSRGGDHDTDNEFVISAVSENEPTFIPGQQIVAHDMWHLFKTIGPYRKFRSEDSHHIKPTSFMGADGISTINMPGGDLRVEGLKTHADADRFFVREIEELDATDDLDEEQP